MRIQSSEMAQKEALNFKELGRILVCFVNREKEVERGCWRGKGYVVKSGGLAVTWRNER